MRTPLLFPAAAVVWTVCFAMETIGGQPPTLSYEPSPNGLQLSWPATLQQPDGSVLRPYFELQRSADLRAWQPASERYRPPASVESVRLLLETYDPHAFYRLLTVVPSTSPRLGSGGAEVFGYGEAFERELARIGQISPAQFASRFSSDASYLPSLSWNPTIAAFWDAFNADIAMLNAGKEPGSPGYRTVDYRLNPAELALFQQNGFVVSERLQRRSFGESFYDLWHNELPVFVSTDAILQAWHRTFDAMLEETEETWLFNSVEAMLDGMAAQIPNALTESAGAMDDSLRDADYFLAVGRSLLAGQAVPAHFSQDTRVAETLADISAEQLKQVGDFMGFCRMVDFSQFKVRGHYENSERLQRYFKCMIWLGRIDLPVAGGPFRRCPFVERFASPRELGTAIVLWRLLHLAGQFETWRSAEQIIGTFVGPTDSMTFGQLGGLLAGAGIRTLANIPDLATLERLQNDIARGELGLQNITSDWFAQPLDDSVAYGLPQTFTVFGQKFVPDSWAFSQTVFNNIEWVDAGHTNLVQRRLPGALDVAFAVLANNQVVPDLVAQMIGMFPDPDRPHALRFRDGHPYQHNLAAARAVMDSQTPEAWDGNIYMSWLACLRELSSPTTSAMFPEAMRTRAWAMKTLNTQLASWTHLRHDTILYSKQSYTFGGDACFYPAGFVEPRVEFWQRLAAMATRTADLIAALPSNGSAYPTLTNVFRFDPVNGTEEWFTETNFVPLATIQSNQVNHLRQFAATVSRLKAMSEKELAQECFDPDDDLFIRNLIRHVGWVGMGCTAGPTKYDGWYPRLFYRAIHWSDFEFHENKGAGAYDAVVADVHTDVPCDDCPVPDPGSVLHEAVGRVNMLLIAVDNGPDRFICAGPVLSHYEFEVTGPPRRISDGEWKVGGGGFPWEYYFRGILDGGHPADVSPDRIEGVSAPEWTRSYLSPRP